MDLLTVPRTDTSLGLRRFSVAGPRVWNRLLHELGQCSIHFLPLSQSLRHTNTGATWTTSTLIWSRLRLRFRTKFARA